jgi:hypothetical protein
LCHDSAVARDRAAGAPEAEIEITPDMIKAGALEFLDVRSLEWEDEEAATRCVLKAVLGNRVKFVGLLSECD